MYILLRFNALQQRVQSEHRSPAENLYANHIQHENTANDNVRQNDVMDPLEGMALRKEEVHGGSGTAAATLQDLGYEPMNGAKGSGEPQEPKPKRKYARKTMKVAVPAFRNGPRTDCNCWWCKRWRCQCWWCQRW